MADDLPKRHFFSSAPGWLVFGLLAVEGLLFLAERSYWLPKSWPVLIAIAAVAVVMLLMVVWFLLGLLFRWRFQVSIRSLLALIVVVALPFNWLAVEMKQAKLQPCMVAEIEKLGGTVENDLLYFSAMRSRHREPPEPLWIRRLLGDDFFRELTVGLLPSSRDDETFARISEVAGIERIHHLWLGTSKITDAGSVGLRRWAGLRELTLPDTAITDAGLENLKGLNELRYLCLARTKVTDAGVKKLQQALPNCKITR